MIARWLADEPATAERWLAIPGYEGAYEVSDQGRVRSYLRSATPRLIKTTPDPVGRAAFSLCKGGQRTTSRVATCVLQAFVGLAPAGYEACHGPAGVSDNSLSNLYWGTRKTNQGRDRSRDGTDTKGVRNGRHVLDVADVLTIRARAAGRSRYGARAIAEEYGISISQVFKVVRRTAWSHVSGAI